MIAAISRYSEVTAFEINNFKKKKSRFMKFYRQFNQGTTSKHTKFENIWSRD